MFLTGSFGKRVAIGVAWVTSARAAVRLLGLVSTLVLARLLVPADFGIVAMAMSIAAALELLTHFGFDSALIQERHVSRAHYDTAWTLNLSLGLALALLLLIAAAPAASFYREPRLEHLLPFIALKYVLDSAGNPGMVEFRRKLMFRQEFALQVGPKFAGILVALPLAFWLRDYHALIAGMLAGSMAAFLLSYAMHPHRPRLCVEQAGSLFRFSRWLLISNFVGFLRKRSADFIIGRSLGAAPLGVFSIGSEIATLPSTEMVAPINRVLFPSYVQLADDPDRLRAGFAKTLGLIALLIVPICVGLAAVADTLVRVALGSKWLETIPLISLLAIGGAANVLTSNMSAVYAATQRPWLIALTGGIQAALLIPMLIVAVHAYGLPGAAWAFLLHALLVALPVSYWIFFRCTPVRPSDVLQACWRPIAACVVMHVAVVQFIRLFATHSDFWRELLVLLAASFYGALSYAALVLLLWIVAGRPSGAETAVLEQIRTSWRQRFGSATAPGPE